MNKEDNDKILDLLCMLVDENKELQQRINKAIEKIEDEIEQSDGCIYVELSEELYIKKLQEYLDILRGETNE